MSALGRPRLGVKFTIEVRQGPDLGGVYQLIPPRVTIGRDPDNHVVLNDPRVSRKAAEIRFTPELIVVRNLSPRVHLFVNGVPSEESPIKHGDIILVGNSELRFEVETLPLPATRSSAAAMAATNVGIPIDKAGRPSSSRQARSQSANRFFFALVFVVVGVGALVALESRKPERKQIKLRTTEDVESAIKQSVENQKNAESKRQFSSEEERTRHREANRHFHEGFRDYQKGRWSRAIKSFETAQIIDPQHVLAKRYFKLADKARDEAIASLLLQGKRYREKSMYRRCAAAFDKVLDEIRNKNDLRYTEAEAFKKECESLIAQPFE